jgi:hypothetical protein
MHEIWKDVNVEGFSHLYQVSNLGNVRSKDRVVQQLDRTGKFITCVYKGRVLKNVKHDWGYLRCVLKSSTQRLGQYIHRLVALTFIENANEMHNVVNHINGIKTDNRVENLEWCDQKRNAEHAKSIGKYKTGTLHFASKPIIQLSMNGEYVAEYVNTAYVQNNFGFSNKNVSQALLKKRNSAYGFKWMFKSEYNLIKK